MILSTKARYAVMAMVDLAMRDSAAPVALQVISDSQEIPIAYLEQIFAKLRKAGLIISARGVAGGYNIAQNLDEILIADIVAASEESLKMTRCANNNDKKPADKKKGCMSKNAYCLTHDLWDGLEQHILGYLSSITLQDLCNNAVSQKFPELFAKDFISVDKVGNA